MVAGSSSWASRSPRPENRPCSATKTWWRIRKWADRSAAVDTARQARATLPAGGLAVADKREVGSAIGIGAPLEQAHRRARLAPGAPGGHAAGAQPSRGQVG